MIVAHLDLDAFFAAVEELERPELRDRPVIVGGDPRGRGVVATANYEARRYGIGSAMSSAEALRRCPHAVFVKPDHTRYAAYSKRVWAAVSDVVPRIERTGLDEGYLDLGGVVRDFRESRLVGEAVQAAVRGAASLTCSLGISTCKVVAKIASDRRKPGGLVVVLPGTEADFLAPLPIRKLPGIGPRGEQRLIRAGVETAGDLAALDDRALSTILPGSVGILLRDRARGIDRRLFGSRPKSVSIGHEETFATDVSERPLLHEELERMAERVAERLLRTDRVARTVTAKLRYRDFSTRSRSHTLPVGSSDAEEIGQIACQLLDRALDERPGALRLVGVSVSNLERHEQLVLDG